MLSRQTVVQDGENCLWAEPGFSALVELSQFFENCLFAMTCSFKSKVVASPVRSRL